MSGLRSIFSNTLAAVSDVAAAAAAAAAPTPSKGGGAVSSLARDPTPTGNSPPQSNLERYIDRACSFLLMEPDLALNMEICDLINHKGANAPHVAAVRIVRHANSKQSNVVRLALELLDVCAKNCGFPFHLQLANREFLNALVKRFPLRPPMLLSSAHIRTLELIEQWHSTIAQDEKTYKDVANIRKMHKLLIEKTYCFPNVAKKSLEMLQKEVHEIRCVQELEEEDISVKRARLQELLRRQRPEDLEDANKLMKEIVGYEDGSDLRLREHFRGVERGDVESAKLRALELEKMLINPENVPAPVAHNELLRSCRAARSSALRILEKRDSDLEHIIELLDILNRVLQLHDSTAVAMERAPAANSTDVAGALFGGISPTKSYAAENKALSPTASNPGKCVDLLNLADEEAAGISCQQPARSCSSFNPSASAKSYAHSETQTVYMSRGLLIEVELLHYATGTEVMCMFSNVSDGNIQSLVWQIATPKSLSLKLGPLSSPTLNARTMHAAKQSFFVSPATGTSADVLTVKSSHARFRVQFSCGIGGEAVDEDGVIALAPAQNSINSDHSEPGTMLPVSRQGSICADPAGMRRASFTAARNTENKASSGSSQPEDLMI